LRCSFLFWVNRRGVCDYYFESEREKGANVTLLRIIADYNKYSIGSP